MKTCPIRATAAVVLVLAAGAAPAFGATDQPTRVGEVVVVGGPGPKVVSSYPADGSEVPAGTLVLKIVFNQPMAPDGWSYGRSETGAFPHCLARPRLLNDQRTFVLLCSVAPHQAYALRVNAPVDFKSEQGRSAKPTELRFSTTDTGPRDIHDALVQAGLTDVDDPVMTWHDDGKGVSASAPPEVDGPPGG